jgi:hypothetical protein
MKSVWPDHGHRQEAFPAMTLHVGGRPDFAVSNATEFGEKIEIRSRSSNGELFTKVVDWSALLTAKSGRPPT